MKSSKGLRLKRGKYSKGVQQFQATLHRNTDSPRGTFLTEGEGSSFPVKLRDNKTVALGNGNKATFDCQVDPPFEGNSKPWIEVDTGNMYCLFFPYSKDMKALKEASFALLLGRLSLSKTGKMMNITSELNNVIISILENSDVQFHWRKNDYLTMSLWEDFDTAQSEVKKLSVKDQIIVMLAATGQGLRMIIRYETDKPHRPNKHLVVCIAFMAVIMPIFYVLLMKRLKESKQKST